MIGYVKQGTMEGQWNCKGPLQIFLMLHFPILNFWYLPFLVYVEG